VFAYQLKKYRKMRKMKQSELIEAVNLILGTNFTAGNVSTWERGVSPKIEVIEAIAEVLKIPVQYLFDDSEECVNIIIKDKLVSVDEMRKNIKKVPLLTGYIGAGSLGTMLEKNMNKYLYIDKEFISYKFINKNIKAITVIGDSMIPYVNSGDIVLFYELERGQYNLQDGKYVITTANGTMVKNLKFKLNGDIVISSCNSVYKDEIIKSDESQEYLEIVGFVVGRILKS